MMTKNIICKNLRKYRELKLRSQFIAATHLGISPQQFSKYENGQNDISATRLGKIAEFLDVPIENFYTDE